MPASQDPSVYAAMVGVSSTTTTLEQSQSQSQLYAMTARSLSSQLHSDRVTVGPGDGDGDGSSVQPHSRGQASEATVRSSPTTPQRPVADPTQSHVFHGVPFLNQDLDDSQSVESSVGVDGVNGVGGELQPHARRQDSCAKLPSSPMAMHLVLGSALTQAQSLRGSDFLNQVEASTHVSGHASDGGAVGSGTGASLGGSVGATESVGSDVGA